MFTPSLKIFFKNLFFFCVNWDFFNSLQLEKISFVFSIAGEKFSSREGCLKLEGVWNNQERSINGGKNVLSININTQILDGVSRNLSLSLSLSLLYVMWRSIRKTKFWNLRYFFHHHRKIINENIKQNIFNFFFLNWHNFHGIARTRKIKRVRTRFRMYARHKPVRSWK